MEYAIGCWIVSVIAVPLFVFTLRALADQSDSYPRFTQRPSSYAQALFIGAFLWSLGSIAPTLWEHRFAFDTVESTEREQLAQDLIPLGPLALGILLFTGGLWLVCAAWTGRVSPPRCRRCGHTRSHPPRRKPGRTCSNCGARFSPLAFGTPQIRLFPAIAGTLLMLAGWYATFIELGVHACFFLIAPLIALAPLLFSAAMHLRPGLAPIGACPHCHYDLSRLPPGTRCPECGRH